MSLNLINIVEKTESILGIHRNYSQTSSKFIRILFISHTVLIFTSLSFTLAIQQVYVMSFMDNVAFKDVWMISNLNQWFEAVVALIISHTRSKNYVNIIKKIKELLVMFPNNTVKKHITLKIFFLFQCVVIIYSCLIDVFTLPMEAIIIFMFTNWYLSLFIHLLVSTMCSIICITVADIINDNLVENMLKLMQVENQIVDVISMNKILKGYSILVFIIQDINQLFGIQIGLYIWSVFIYNFIMIASALINEKIQEYSFIRIISYAILHLLLLSTLIVLAAAGQMICNAIDRFYITSRKLNNHFFKQIGKFPEIHGLLLLLSVDRPRIHVMNLFDMKMNIIPLFFGTTATYTIAFMQFNKFI